MSSVSPTQKDPAEPSETQAGHGQVRRSRLLARWCTYFVARGLMAWMRRLPIDLAVELGARLGGLFFRLNRTERRRTIEHLTIAFGSEWSPEKIRRTAVEAFRNMGRNVCEYVHLAQMAPAELRANVVRFDGFEHLERARDAGRGVIVATAHLGNWELIGAGWGARGWDVAIVARRIYFDPYNALIEQSRTAARLETIYQDRGPRPILRALRRGALLVILPDQDVPRLDGIFTNLFGRPAYTPLGPFGLALTAKVPLLAVFGARIEGGHYACAHPPIEIEPTGDRARDIQAMAQVWTDQFEAFLRRFPAQWVWNHRRWRTRPPDEPPQTPSEP